MQPDFQLVNNCSSIFSFEQFVRTVLTAKSRIKRVFKMAEGVSKCHRSKNIFTINYQRLQKREYDDDYNLDEKMK